MTWHRRAPTLITGTPSVGTLLPMQGTRSRLPWRTPSHDRNHVLNRGRCRARNNTRHLRHLRRTMIGRHPLLLTPDRRFGRSVRIQENPPVAREKISLTEA